MNVCIVHWLALFTKLFLQNLCIRLKKKYNWHWNKNLQAQPIDPDLTAKLLGRGVAVSPIVTVEPRRRKFHKAITLSMPAPKAHSQGMINQYSGNAPTLRLLCSITGEYEHFNYTSILYFIEEKKNIAFYNTLKFHICCHIKQIRKDQIL